MLQALQADFVRINVICDYGGIWLDSDTLVLDSLDILFDIIDNSDGFLVIQPNNKLCNGIFGSNKNTDFIIKWKIIPLKYLIQNIDINIIIKLYTGIGYKI